jgi:hypothetical protein
MEDKSNIASDDGAAETLPTALDVAQARSQFDAQPLTSHFYTALRSGNPRNLPPEMLRDGKAVQITPATVEAIRFNTDATPPAPEVLDKLRDIQARMQATLKRTEEFSLARVSDHLNTKRDEMHTAIAAGEDSDAVLPSRNDIAATFRAKQAALMAVLVKITHAEVVPLCRPILEDFEKLVEDFLRGQEAHDRDMCAGFGLDYRPGLLWQAGVTVATRYTLARKLPAPGTWAIPASILEGIVIL